MNSIMETHVHNGIPLTIDKWTKVHMMLIKYISINIFYLF